MSNGIPHGDEILAEEGIGTLVWVCPWCNCYKQREQTEEVRPICTTGEGIDVNPCWTEMIKGVLVSRTIVYNATTV